MAIVSGAFRAEIEPVVAAAGIADDLSMIVTADDVKHGKPHPQGYLLRSSGSDRPARTLAFEDTEAGVARRRTPVYVASPCAARCPTSGSRADELVDPIDVALMERLIG